MLISKLLKETAVRSPVESNGIVLSDTIFFVLYILEPGASRGCTAV